jgi:hypothetical protein
MEFGRAPMPGSTRSPGRGPSGTLNPQAYAGALTYVMHKRPAWAAPRPSPPVFNRTVALRDTWAKIQKKCG